MTAGDRFGYLTVIETLQGGDVGHHDGAWVRVRCVCGIRKTVLARNLRLGLIRSCGCEKEKIAAQSRGLAR